MRLFLALDLPDTILTTLDALIAKLKPAAGRISWSSAAKLHITTKFIGEWPEARLAELKTAIATMPRKGVFEVRVEGLGWFPNPRAPRVLWAGVHRLAGTPPLRSGLSCDEKSVDYESPDRQGGVPAEAAGPASALEDLARDTDRAAAAFGIAPETRAFRPHLTLARIKQPSGNLTELRQAVARAAAEEFGQFEARSQFLYLSRLSPSGSVYQKLEEFPFS